MDSDVAPDARSVFINQATTQLIGEGQVESIAKQIGGKGEIAILSATANATNQNAWIKVMKDELKKPEYKDIKLVKVAYGDDDDQKSFQETQGLIQAYPNLKGIISPDDGRRLRRRALPVDLAEEGQGQADRPRHPEPDAQVRQGRHRRRVPAVGAQGRRLPRRPGRRGARLRAHHRQGGREVQGRPARRATRSAPTARSCSARRRASTRTTSTTSTSRTVDDDRHGQHTSAGGRATPGPRRARGSGSSASASRRTGPSSTGCASASRATSGASRSASRELGAEVVSRRARRHRAGRARGGRPLRGRRRSTSCSATR